MPARGDKAFAGAARPLDELVGVSVVSVALAPESAL